MRGVMEWLRLESVAFWSTFVVAFFAIALWESAHPERPLVVAPSRRWSMHGVLLLVASAVGSTLVRLSPVAAALQVEDRSGTWVSGSLFPGWFLAAGSYLLLDFAKYAYHWLAHSVPLLWRVHRVHHADPDFDLTTGLRFHPIEATLARGWHVGVVLVLAPPVGVVLAAELMSCLAAFFGHANAALPEPWDRRLRRVLVTPNVHRLHHSERIAEQRKNLGEVLTWWDRLFGTYREPRGAQDRLVVGLPGYQNAGSLHMTDMLAEPFRAQRQEPPADA